MVHCGEIWHFRERGGDFECYFDMDLEMDLLALSLRLFSARTFALAASRSASTSCKLTLSLIRDCMLSVNALMSPISCKRFESLNGTKICSAFRAAVRNPALLARCDLYKEVKIFALKLVSGVGACFDGGDNVIEGYPFVREQASGVIICESHKKGFMGSIIANVVG